MMEEKQLVPKRRFKGFSDEWEECELRDAAESFEYGLNAPAINFDGENKYIRITDIDENTRLFNQNELTSPKTDLAMAANYLLRKGDLLFARTGASVGKTYRYQNYDGKVYYAGFLIRARIKNGFDSEFIFQQTLTQRYYSYIKITSQRSGQPGINAKEYADYKLMLPSMKEQEKIGQFLKHLDEMIELEQRKIDKTLSLKSAYLAEMFPTEGERIPKRRFEGFTDEWEICQFEDIIDMYNNLRIPVTASDRIPGTTPYFGANGIQDYVQGSTHEGEFVLIAEDGANDLTNYPVQYVNGKAWVNNHAHVVTGKENIIDNLFLVSRMKSMDISKWLVGGGRAKLNAVVLKSIQIKIPSFKEQKRIGLFFKNLDKEISIQEQKLEKLKAIKQAYLQEMFV